MTQTADETSKVTESAAAAVEAAKAASAKQSAKDKQQNREDKAAKKLAEATAAKLAPSVATPAVNQPVRFGAVSSSNTTSPLHVLDPQSAFALSADVKNLSTLSVWGDPYAVIQGDHSRLDDFKKFVDMLLSLSNIPKNLPNYTSGRELLMKRLACLHLTSFVDLGRLHLKNIIDMFAPMEPAIRSAACTLGKFLQLDQKEVVLKSLEIKVEDLDPKTVWAVLTSWERLKDFVEDEDLKLIPTPNEINSFIVKTALDDAMFDNNMTYLLKHDKHGLKEGVHYFENRWLARKLKQRTRKTSSSYILEREDDWNGVAAYEKLCEVFLPKEKISSLLTKLIASVTKMELRRVTDIHTFFTTYRWHVRAINSLLPDGDQWDKATEDDKCKEILVQSESKSNQLTSVVAQLRAGQTVDHVKSELYKVFSEEKFKGSGANLPVGFFPDYTNVRKFGELTADLKRGNNPPSLDATRAHKMRQLKIERMKRDAKAAEHGNASSDDDEESPPPDKQEKKSAWKNGKDRKKGAHFDKRAAKKFKKEKK